MTDLEMTKLCAEAMGIEVRTIPTAQPKDTLWYTTDNGQWTTLVSYRPLHDDAQAMALVKKFGIDIQFFYWDDPVASKTDAHWKLIAECKNPDLNRAIVECVANIHKAREYSQDKNK